MEEGVRKRFKIEVGGLVLNKRKNSFFMEIVGKEERMGLDR